MKGEGHIAVGALDNLAAGTARQEARIASPVQEKHHLMAGGQALGHLIFQGIAQNGAVPFFQLFPKINDGNLGEGGRFHPPSGS